MPMMLTMGMMKDGALGSCVQSSNQEEEKKLANYAEHDPSAARREPSKTVQPSAKVLNSYKL
jgi:hypothetical protein